MKDIYSLSLDEARAVLDACRDTREKALVHLYLGHGLRLEEGVKVNIGDIGMPMNHLRGYLDKYSPVRLVNECKGLPDNRVGKSVI